jgi:predicted transcriptional regulator
MSISKEQQQLMEWRRDKVIMLSSRGLSQSEIARVLHVERSLVSKDMTYIRQQAREHLKTHIQNRMPEEYHKVEVSIKQVLMKAWEIVDNTTDERIRLQALSLIRECDSSRLEMITNGTVVSEALKYVNGKAEKLSAVAAEAEKESVASYEEEEEIEGYQT